MYSRLKLVYNEKEEAKSLYVNGFNNDFNWRKFKLICMYMAYELGFGKQKIKTKAVSFCEKQDRNFNYISNRKKNN